jgi:hypothetical protein
MGTQSARNDSPSRGSSDVMPPIPILLRVPWLGTKSKADERIKEEYIVDSRNLLPVIVPNRPLATRPTRIEGARVIWWHWGVVVALGLALAGVTAWQIHARRMVLAPFLETHRDSTESRVHVGWLPIAPIDDLIESEPPLVSLTPAIIPLENEPK